MRVSVIIPVYNAERYLDAALKSVFDQRGVCLEVIAIDDGSTDASSDVLGRWARRYTNLTVIHQANAGQGAARNRGLDRATGDFVYLMDADDELADGLALSNLADMMKTQSLDVVLFDAETLYDEGCVRDGCSAGDLKYIRRHDYSAVRSGADMLTALYAHDEYTESPCLYMARRTFVENASLRFCEGMYFEDCIYTLNLFLTAGRMVHVPARYYRRYVHASSTTTAKPTARHLRGRLECYRFGVGLCVRTGLSRRVRSVVRDLTWRYKWLARRMADEMQASVEDWPLLAEVRRVTLREMLGSALRCLHDEGFLYTLRRILCGRRLVR